jgi:hypothetical protein
MSQPTPSPSSGFRAWLEGFPVVYGLVGAALAAVLGLLAPDRLIPEPLQSLRPIVSVYVVATLVLAWAWRTSLRRKLKRFAAVTFVLATLFAALNLLLVRTVTYSRPDGPVERPFLTGMTPVRSEDRGMSAEDLIKQYGDGWTELTVIYGNEFTGIAVGYTLTYLALILAMVLAIAASDLLQRARRDRA